MWRCPRQRSRLLRLLRNDLRCRGGGWLALGASRVELRSCVEPQISLPSIHNSRMEFVQETES